METPQPEPPINDIVSQVTKRLRAEKRWSEAEPVRDRLMREARASGLAKIDAQQSTYQKLHELFPTLPPPPEPTAVEPANDLDSESTNETANQPETPQTANEDQKLGMEETGDKLQTAQNGTGDRTGDVANRSDQRDEPNETVAEQVAGPSTRPRSGESTVHGLGEIPVDWPMLPSNASLSTEVQWVLANRIRVIRETQDGTTVDLTKALTPAPSYATLGWLETSIRAFAKFVDVSTKASASGQDDAEKVKRERLAIAEIRDLLGQMRSQVASK